MPMECFLCGVVILDRLIRRQHDDQPSCVSSSTALRSSSLARAAAKGSPGGATTSRSR